MTHAGGCRTSSVAPDATSGKGMNANKPVGFVGTGNMGGRITRRLVSAGHAVLGIDAVPGRAQACGATAAKGLKRDRRTLRHHPAAARQPGGRSRR